MSLGIVIGVIVVFGMLVTFHEAGHFTIAKLNGVRVLEFSIGFGPPLVSHQWGETLYAVRSIPLGGYVRLAGMDDGDNGPNSFGSKAVWRRLAIIAAGSLTNLLLPIFIFYGIAIGVSGGPVVAAEVISNNPAADGGIQPGDQILAVDGHPLRYVTELRQRINSAGGRSVRIQFQHRGLAPQEGNFEPIRVGDRYLVGVRAGGGAFDPLGSLGQAVGADIGIVGQTIGGFGTLLRGHIPGGLAGPCGPSGPVGIVRATAEAANAGWLSLAEFAAFLSVNLGILNLLPLPALDGGRLAFLVIEAIRGRPVDPLKEQRVHYIGLAILLTFVAFVTYNDVVRLGVPMSALISRCQG